MFTKLILVLVLVCGVCLALPANFLAGIPAPPPPDQCSSAYSCVGEGDTCVGTFPITANCASPTSNTTACCPLGLLCISGTCQVDNYQASCNATTLCVTTLAQATIQCVAGECAYLGGVGDSCINSSYCMNNLNCSNSICTGLTLYTPCLPNQCAYNLFCGLNMTTQTQMCLNTLPAGQNCSLTSAQCAPDTTCFNGVCTSAYSIAAGSPCLAGSDLCVEDYICPLANKTCVEATTSFTTCTNATTDCPANVPCICSQFSGKSYCKDPMYDDCTEEASSLSSCLNQYMCTSSSLAPTSCSYTNCYSELKKSQSCGCTPTSSYYDTCVYNQYCGGFPVWAIIVIIVVAIVLVLAIVLLVFFMMRRRRQYDSI